MNTQYSDLPATSQGRGNVAGISLGHRRSGLVPLVLAAVVWGAWRTAEKYSLQGLSVTASLGLALATAAGLLWAVLLYQGHERPTLRQLKLLALLGFLEPMLGYGAIGLGLVYVEATQASLLAGAESCFVVALSALVGRRLPTGGAIVGVLMAAFGVTILGGVHSGVGLSGGDVLVLLGNLAAAIATIVTGRIVLDVDPLVVTAYQFGFGFLFTVPLLVWQWIDGGRITTDQVRPGHWIVAVVVCGGGLAVAFLLYNYAITRTSVCSAGVVLNTIPLFGLAAAVLFLNESLHPWQFVGAAFILGGIFMFSERDMND